jgi:hypothetical protein
MRQPSKGMFRRRRLTWKAIVKFSFRIHATRADGTVNRRFHKVCYTAALRFGEVLPAERGFVEVSFEGEPAYDVVAHGDNEAHEGRLTLNEESFADVVAIVKTRSDRKVDLITFWPRSQHPDAHQSYTDPLVDTACDGTAYPIEIVATRMFPAFEKNPGASPATLMKILYEEESDELRRSGQRLAELLQESFDRERDATIAQERERAAREKVEAELDATKVQLDELRSRAYIRPPIGSSVDSSGPVRLKRATKGRRGKLNQPAVLLHMSDGTIRANNWDRDFDARYEYAKNLEGSLVRTDVWGGYSWRDWFKNIYPVEEHLTATAGSVR